VPIVIVLVVCHFLEFKPAFKEIRKKSRIDTDIYVKNIKIFLDFSRF